MNHLKINPLHMPIRFRPLDAILLGLLLIVIAWQAIEYSELDDLRKEVHAMEVRP